MSAPVVYFDSSALIKLVFQEPETAALERFLVAWPERAASVIARIEVTRVAATVNDPTVLRQTRSMLEQIHLIALTDTVVTMAMDAQPQTLRALDAIHLGSALSLGSDLAGVVAYDRRLVHAARHAGLTVWSPS